MAARLIKPLQGDEPILENSHCCNIAALFLTSFPIELMVFFSVLLMFPFIIIAMHLTHCDVLPLVFIF